MAEFRRYPLRLEQSKLDGWWFIFVDALPGLLVFGPNYEDLLGRLKVAAGNLFRARGETVTNIEIIAVESAEVVMELWMVPAESAAFVYVVALPDRSQGRIEGTR
jgi:predicted RNase H-like HicB family nuclease